MAAPRLMVLVVMSFALLAPVARAASAGGELESGSIQLAPGATFAAAGLDLLLEALPATAITLDANEIAVHKIGTSYLGDGQVFTGSGETVDERTSHPAGRLTLIPTEDAATVAIRTLGPTSGALGSSEVRGVEGSLLMARRADYADAAACDPDDYGCLDVFGVYEIRGDAVTLDVSGELEMIIYGATLVVEDARGERTEYTSGQRTSEQTGPITRTEDATLLVRATSVSGQIAGSARAFSAAPTIRTPAATFEDASGAVRVGARDYRAQNDDVAAAGALIVIPGPVVRAASHGDGSPIYASTITTRVSGDIETIDLEGHLAFFDTPAQQAGAAAIALALVGGAAYAWQHLSFAAAVLYTRLNKPEILENDVRNHIFDIIVQNPGISAREVHRRSEQSWGTVVYHLRQLERHHLVVSRALGRTRNYYENHGKYRGMEAQLACLQSDRARALARAIAAQPGITQEQLAVAAALPQPTTSYYVRKLKQAGLVEEQRDGRYVKYVPHADLPRFIELSERSVQSGGASGSGVQA